MEGQEFVDFFELLPLEISQHILCLLIKYKDDSLTNCRLVCKNWDAIISSSAYLWKFACGKLGYLKEENGPDTDYKDIFLRMRKRLQQMKSSFEFFDLEHISSHDSQQICKCYHNGVVALGDRNSINIVHLEPNFSAEYELDFVDDDSAQCIHFDASYLVVGTCKGRVITFKMPTMEALHTRMSPISDRIWCMTFNKDIDVLVTSSDEYVTFWCLSSGTVHLTYYTHYADRLYLIPTPNLQDGCDCILLCVDCHLSYRILFNSQQITVDKIYTSVFRQYDDPSCLTLITSYFRDPFLYFLVRSCESWIATLFKYDPIIDKLEDIGRFNFEFMELVGVGRKYACFLDITEMPSQNFIIYDLATESVLTSFIIVGAPLDSIVHAIFLDHASWLDGFDGLNDKGAILVIEFKGGAYVLKWPE